MKKAEHGVLWAVDKICIVLFTIMIVGALLQVFFRYVMRISVPMTEELVRACYTLLIYTAIITVESQDKQLQTTYCLELLPFKARWVIYGIINVACAAFLLAMAYGGIIMFESSRFMRFGTMPWLSANITYIPLFVSPVFVIYFLIKRIVFFRDTAVGKAASAYDHKDGEEQAG